jgi:pantothenate kinase
MSVDRRGAAVRPGSGDAGPEVYRSLAAVLARGRRLAARQGRSLLGIAGPPGAGKSTLATMLADAIGEQARVIGLDGFHLAQSQLVALGRRDRMGAIDTFDGAGFATLIRRLREQNGDETVYAPEFRREFEESIAGAIAVEPDVRLVIVEGNYLLADAAPWDQLRGLFDEIWYCDHEQPDRVAALIARHRAFGKSQADAEAWAAGSDQRNAEAIQATRGHADIVVELDWSSAAAPAEP